MTDPVQLKLMSSGVEYYDRYHQHPSDSVLWLHLFSMADSRGGEKLATTLEVIRNTGATLEPSVKYGYMIKPVFGAQGFADEREYEKERWRLKPYEGVLLGMLGDLKEVRP